MGSYHLTGAAQTWYDAQLLDEGMPSWERFKELCRLRFGPPIYGSRLAELGRLPFHSTVQEFAGRFQTILAHSRDISMRQKAELFVGGLPKHIRVDVAMRALPDLQLAMFLAHAFESRAIATAALFQTQQQRGAHQPPRSAPPPRHQGRLWFLLAHRAFQHQLQQPLFQLPRAQQHRRDSFDVSR